ncbi:hypothetical protein [Desulforamulus hydrothermalis]|nr:hypothetical protein [Desulforamulus hydrothermalis]SHH05650.1 hypothetical protein SAMN02745177_01290 [Desulforamulus hydrothermalis Lam5 = DSM 18033]
MKKNKATVVYNPLPAACRHTVNSTGSEMNHWAGVRILRAPAEPD